ncbi:MAG TPA: hypothetical protein VFY39_12015 [Gammaproteobacteria bacterium]|nr:hypothetical protein [Gammaproteobacteria bacterium]
MRHIVLALLLVVAAPLAQGEVLLLDSVNAEAATASSRPSGGMTMKNVEAKFGMPTKKHAAVGKPPITRWDYPGFSVYFEYQYVIHAVPAHAAPDSNKPEQ